MSKVIDRQSKAQGATSFFENAIEMKQYDNIFEDAMEHVKDSYLDPV